MKDLIEYVIGGTIFLGYLVVSVLIASLPLIIALGVVTWVFFG